MKYAIAYRDCDDCVRMIVGEDGEIFTNIEEAEKAGYKVLYRTLK